MGDLDTGSALIEGEPPDCLWALRSLRKKEKKKKEQAGQTVHLSLGRSSAKRRTSVAICSAILPSDMFRTAFRSALAAAILSDSVGLQPENQSNGARKCECTKLVHWPF